MKSIEMLLKHKEKIKIKKEKNRFLTSLKKRVSTVTRL